MRVRRIFILPVIMLLAIMGVFINTQTVQADDPAARSFELVQENGVLLGTYGSWREVVQQINQRNEKDMVYRVFLPEQAEVSGALTMPGKNKYAGIVFESGSDGGGTFPKSQLHATGNLALTADLTVGSGVSLSVKGISGSAWSLKLEENSNVATEAALTVKVLSLGRNATVHTAGKLTVKDTLEADAGAALILAEKKGVSVKHTRLTDGDPIEVLVRNAWGEGVTLPEKAVVITTTGDSYGPQYALLDGSGSVQGLYRKGNTIRVLGAQEASVSLYDATGADLGSYLTLADIRTEINRRKRQDAVYGIVVAKEQFVKGALPLPSAKNFRQLTFSGERISITGNVTLTGEVHLENTLRKVRNNTDRTAQPLTMNLSKYHFVIKDGELLENIGAISGGAGSVLEIASGAEQEISGNLKVETLILNGSLSVGGNVTLTDVTVGINNEFRYDVNKKVAVKGQINAEEAKLLIAPQKSGVLLGAFPDGIRLMNSVPKADVQSFALLQGTSQVFYREKDALKLGTARIALFDGTTDYETCQSAAEKAQFVTFNDVIDHINGSAEKEFVARLDSDIPSGGKFKNLGQGKHLVLCGKNAESLTLHFTGAILLDGCTLQVRNLMLDNKTTAGPSVTMKNGGAVVLDNTAVGAVTTKAGSVVTLAREVAIRGALSGQGDLYVEGRTAVRCSGNISVRKLVLTGDGAACLRLQTGKKLTATDTVTTAGNNYFVINIVDKQDALASIGRGTVLAVAQYGDVSQFRTDNIATGTLLKWGLEKQGNQIKTSEASEGEGEWSDDYF